MRPGTCTDLVTSAALLTQVMAQRRHRVLEYQSALPSGLFSITSPFAISYSTTASQKKGS